MAIVQISRITNRKGLIDDLPAPLAGAEFGWATDTRQLFIGNGEIADGAPVVGNTEILTEFSDILSYTTAYTYTGQAATGYTVQTGPTPSTPISQSLQARLDSYAIVTDFGAVGDGITDCTAAINRALYQLYCVDNNPAIRRSLFFPAGVYLISGTINLPTYATLYGEGVDGSTILLQIQVWSNGTSYQSGVLVSYSGSYYRSLLEVPTGIDITNTTYWEEQSEPSCIVQTADSLQQTGVDINTNGATPPQGIYVANLKFTTTREIDAILIEDAKNCEFNTVSFEGPLTTLDISSSPPEISAVTWSSTESLVCQNIRFTNCTFTGFKYCTNTDQQIKSIVFANNRFDTLFQGVYLGGVSPVLGGPTGVRILHNVFDNIYNQGIVVENVSLNASGYNIFYDVGNEFNGVDYPAVVIVEFNAANNVSVGDMFERTDAVVSSSGIERININDTLSIATDNGVSLQLGSYTRDSGVVETLPNGSTDVVLFTVDAASTRAFSFNYTMTRLGYTESGVVTVVASSDGTGGDLSTIDSVAMNNGVTGTGVALTISETSSVVSVKYTNTTGSNASISYSFTRLA